MPTPDVSRQPDFNAVAAATLRHRYDLGRQDMGTLESVLEFYTTHQFQVSQANVLLLDFTTGPRTSPFELGSARRHDAAAVPDRPLRRRPGHGLLLGLGRRRRDRRRPSARPSTERVTAFARRRDYLNNPTVPTNNESTGVEGTLTAKSTSSSRPR